MTDSPMGEMQMEYFRRMGCTSCIILVVRTKYEDDCSRFVPRFHDDLRLVVARSIMHTDTCTYSDLRVRHSCACSCCMFGFGNRGTDGAEVPTLFRSATIPTPR